MCLFPTCLDNNFVKSKEKKRVKLALPASNKLGTRCSDSVPEGVGRLVFWIYRVCCFESTFKVSVL